MTKPALEDRTFVTREWYKKYQDKITPAGLAFYQSDWDLSVKEFFHKTLNTKEPGKCFDSNTNYKKSQTKQTLSTFCLLATQDKTHNYSNYLKIRVNLKSQVL